MPSYRLQSPEVAPVPPLSRPMRWAVSGLGATAALLLAGVSIGLLEAAGQVPGATAPTLFAAPGQAVPNRPAAPLPSRTAVLPGTPADPTFSQSLSSGQLPLPGMVTPRALAGPISIRRRSFGLTRGGAMPGFSAPGGPLSARLSQMGEVIGPQWLRAPLPAVVPGARLGLATGFLPGSLGSELPDSQSVALSRLANPTAESGGPITIARVSQASAEQPVSVSIQVHRPAQGIVGGQPVTVRVTAGVEAYLALIRVDSAGHGSLVFRSPGLSRSFVCGLKASPVGGSEYLLAVASAHPFSSGDVGSAVRSVGAGAIPAAAWREVAGQAAALGGGAQTWQRFEWAIATASYVAQTPPRPVLIAANSGTVAPGGAASAAASGGSTAPGAAADPAGGAKPTPDKPILPEKPATADRPTAAEKSAAAEKPSASGSPAAAQKPAAESVVPDKNAVDKAAAERAAADKAVAEKAAADKAAAEKAAADKAAAEKSAADKAAAEKTAADKTSD